MNVNQDIGPYRILAKLGEGGMGEVYKARHATLDRLVAIKVLPAALASDPTARDRFEAEAKAVAALSHPNILAIHDFGVDAGVAYAVTELLDGVTLRERLKDGALPRRHAVDIAAQVATGLAASHEAGLVHRDIKPENIFLTPAGQVKILDFGIARQTRSASHADANSPTFLKTDPGTVMGTVGYMSPEQVRGDAVDSRSDIFSLGCVIFEMVTGRRAFERPTAVETMTAILREDPPDVTVTDAAIPSALEHLIHHCLEKSPGQRFQSARDLAFALKALSGSTATGSLPGIRTAGRRRRTWLFVGAAAAVLLAGGAALGRVAWRTASPASHAIDVVQFAFEPAADTSLFPFDTKGIAISPDGTTIAFVAEDRQGRTSLYLRGVAAVTVAPVAGTDDASYPFWAPDSRQLGFFANHKLNRVDIKSGRVVALCDAESGRGGTWNRDGVIVFAPTLSGGLLRIPAGGGRAEPAMPAGHGAPRARWPWFLPDGRTFLFIDGENLVAASLGGDSQKPVLTNVSNAVFAPPDRLVFSRGAALMSQRFNTETLAVEGQATPLPFGDVAYMDPKHLSIVSASESGALIFLPAPDTATRLVWVDARGREDGEIGEAGAYEDAALSPDGKRIAVVRGGSNANDIWLLDTADGHLSRFTFHPGTYGFPRWSADSRQLAYFLLFGGIGQACLKSLDGAERCPVLKTSSWQVPLDFSRAGDALLTWTQSATGAGDIYTMTLGPKPAVTPFLSTPFDEGSASVSPDGKWVAYQSNASLRNEVYVRRSTPSNEQWQISTAGGEGPVWSADGHELFYGAGDMVMHVTIGGGTTPNAGAPAPLFRIPGGQAAPRISGTLSRPVISGIARDKRFLFRLASGQRLPSIHVVLNWQNVLR